MFFCLTFDNSEKLVKLYQNSNKIFEKQELELKDFQIHEDSIKNLQFGKASKFAGKISELNIWSKVLDEDAIKNLYECKHLKELPDILDWKTEEFDFGPNITMYETLDDICMEKHHPNKEAMVYSISVSMGDHRKAPRLCEALGGAMTLAENNEELDALQDGIRNIPESCKSLWLPIFKSETNGKWMSDDLSFVEFTKWHAGQPNGGKDVKKCAVLDREFEYWDEDCNQKNCFYCNMEDFTLFRLKGLYQSDSYIWDHKFVIRSKALVGGKPTWKGFTSNIIQWNEDGQSWEMLDQVNNFQIATLNGSNEVPVGEHVWSLQHNDICSNMVKGSQINLMLSKCTEFEFSCSDGSCIPIDRKCDYVADCFDKSDEVMCSTLNKEDMESYDVGILDIITNEKNEIIKNPINISIDINNIESIEEVQMRFTADFTVNAEWLDTRLTWNDLNQHSYLNMPSEQEKKQFWIPKFVFGNSENNLEIPIDSKAKVLVKMKGPPTMSDQFHLKETAHFSGAGNPLLLSRNFNERFKCDFNLRYYPFDTQSCIILINANNKMKNFVQLTPSRLDYIGPTHLQNFEVLDWLAEIDTSESDVNIRIKIVLKRKVLQHLLSIYFPSLCIMVIAQVKMVQKFCFELQNLGNFVFQARTFQDQHPRSHNCHAGDVHSQPGRSFKTSSNFYH